VPPGERAGLSHGTCHELRHTCFTRLREAGMAIEAIQAQAGHRSITSTRVYLHLDMHWLADEYRRAIEAIEAQAWWGWPNERPGHHNTPPTPTGRRDARGDVGRDRRQSALMVATMASYLDQLEVSARPSTVAHAELTLRLFAHRVTAADPTCVAVAGIGRVHIEDFKRWLAARPGKKASPCPP
jgi:hypothetical protein